nr:MAG TPA_asm: hypothetical protein [Caudoviricetes sp.]
MFLFLFHSFFTPFGYTIISIASALIIIITTRNYICQHKGARIMNTKSKIIALINNIEDEHLLKFIYNLITKVIIEHI